MAIIYKNLSTSEASEAQARARVSVDLSPTVILHLDAISAITGASRAQIVQNALLQQLPGLIAHAQGLQWNAPPQPQPMNFQTSTV